MYRYLRSLRDDIVISSRVDKGRYGDGTTENYLWWDHDKYAGDYQEREQYVGGLTFASGLSVLSSSPASFTP
jgi:hypothetical protein